ncbi:glycoside hydrolase family 18 protein, partial [Anaerocolumna aminovalerica]|uniref:glycoside hydrolase family 18 protein n=1 Tax=Anaerocolumna aminovalerica TaxID=1527 RepID=UPI00248AD31F
MYLILNTSYKNIMLNNKRKNLFLKSIFKALLVVSLILTGLPGKTYVEANSGATTRDHNKQVIGYITQWDAWKGSNAGLPSEGALTHLNIDYSKYTILNYSFFGVANDGSLHSGDYRNKNIYKEGVQQQPAPMFNTDIYSSWDLFILFGELEPVYSINADIARRAKEQGFDVVEWGNTWSKPSWGLYNQPLPMPLKKDGGAPGVLELAKQNGVKVMASIGGWSMCKHFPEIAADPVKRAKFIQDCVRLIQLGFDGIDLDWEYPGPFSGMNFTGSEMDYNNFITLTKEIRQAIGNNKLITSCFSADTRKLEGFNWNEVNKYVDYYNFMTYDFNGGWSDKTGHNAPLYGYPNAEAPNFNWDYLYQYLVQKGVNLNKVNMGIPFYGRGFITDGAAALNKKTVKRAETIQPDGPIMTCADFTNWARDVYDGTPNFNYIKKTALQSNSGWTKHWDAQAKVPYLTKNNFFLSYDDEESIGYKAQYIKDKNLAGTIIWTGYGDVELSGTVTNYG